MTLDDSIPTYSDETIKIINLVSIETLRECHNLRRKAGLISLNDEEVLEHALEIYKERMKKAVVKRRNKGGEIWWQKATS